MKDEAQKPVVRPQPDESGVSPAQTLVSGARRHLGMDLAFVAEIAGGRRTFRFVDAIPGAVRLQAGGSHDLAETYCRGIVDGSIPQVIPDTSREPSVKDLRVTGSLGIASYIGVPVRYSDGRLFGTLCCLAHTTHGELGEDQRRYLAVLAETIAAELDQRSREVVDRQESRERIERTIGEQSFFPVYQPIVELASGRVVGAEALTRFTADARGPFAWFSEAAIAGLGMELELAAAAKALEGFQPSPDVYLALNLSPSALDGLFGIITRDHLNPGGIIVELTEHTAVGDYSAVLRTMEKLRGLSVRIAVDDTGAGVSSLRHILELGPDIIKLDLTLTAGIDSDPARQALALALAAFAERTGAVIIAEGIETPEQLRTVADLGIGFGQGYYLGRPKPLPLAMTAHFRA